MVWKATTQVGAGLAIKKNSKGRTVTYVVARYTPPGNYLGQFGRHVMPTKNEVIKVKILVRMQRG